MIVEKQTLSNLVSAVATTLGGCDLSAAELDKKYQSTEFNLGVLVGLHALVAGLPEYITSEYIVQTVLGAITEIAEHMGMSEIVVGNAKLDLEDLCFSLYACGEEDIIV